MNTTKITRLNEALELELDLDSQKLRKNMAKIIGKISRKYV